MRLLAIDFGTKKCGIAISDPLKIIATPLKVIFYSKNDYLYLINEIKKIIKEFEPIEKIILGITKNIDKSISSTGKITLKFLEILKNQINIEVVLIDEKNTTKNALNVIKEMNVSNEKKRNIKDAIAAQKILEDYILQNK